MTEQKSHNENEKVMNKVFKSKKSYIDGQKCKYILHISKSMRNTFSDYTKL